MPNNTLILLRHAEVKVEEKVVISKWSLTERGQKKAMDLFDLDFFQNVDIIITSGEEKAFQTAYPLSEKLHKKIVKDENLNEISRDQGKYFKTKDEYLDTMKLCVENRTKSFNSWETANHALERFSNTILDIDSKYTNKKILIVAHGGVINLYFASILEQFDKIFKRFLSNSFLDYGIIQDSKIIKDISRI
ncbi:MAG: histidine phosphatase family protein [Candidatus Lokiarchaeota archaeon]|nr:histidine phosphatase family protein [Candidatus Lokiarchaeota archaeon]